MSAEEVQGPIKIVTIRQMLRVKRRWRAMHL